MEEVSKELLDNVKTTLQVTWDSEDEQIKDFILQAAAYVESKAGPLDFEEASPAGRLGQKLLREYVRYDWNGYSNMFSRDYQADILNLQIVVAQERGVG